MITLAAKKAKNNSHFDFYFSGHGCKDTGDWVISDSDEIESNISCLDLFEAIKNGGFTGKL